LSAKIEAELQLRNAPVRLYGGTRVSFDRQSLVRERVNGRIVNHERQALGQSTESSAMWKQTKSQ
jgi:hypothetical protein